MGLRTILFLSVFLSFKAFAQVEVVAGSSLNVNQPVTESWGVFVGEFDLSKTSGGYNNCDLPPGGLFLGCHEERVNGDTAVTVTFKYTGADAANGLLPLAVILGANDGSGSTIAPIEIGRNNNAVSVGDGTATVSFTWANLCVQLVGSSGNATFDEATQTCSLSGQIQVSFGIGNDPNNFNSSTSSTFIIYNPEPFAGTIAKDQCAVATPNPHEQFGFCDIAVTPGDSGGFLKANTDVDGNIINNNTIINQSFTITDFVGTAGVTGTTRNISIEGIKLYLAETYLNAQPWVSGVKAFENFTSSFDGKTAKFDDTYFGKLTNDTTYFVRAATIDSSGTISQLFDQTFSNDMGVTGIYSITPSEVAGIIRENDCFITTATYGSGQAKQVNLFRKFRKLFLYGNSFGHKVILAYNTYGPKGAKWIRENPSSRSFMRVLLYPFYGFAYLSVHYGLIVSSSVFTLFFFVLLYLFRLFKREGEK